MEEIEWTGKAHALASAHSALEEPSHPFGRLVANVEQELLADVDGLIRSAPDALLDIFRNWPEQLVSEGTARKLHAVEQGQFGWKATHRDSPESWLQAAVEQVRALDEHLAFSSDAGDGPQANPGLWHAVRQDVFVVPSRGRLRHGGIPKAGQPYSRRGLLYHRVLPTQVGDLKVRPIEMGVNAASTPADRDALTLGAALFPGAKLGIRSVPPLPHRPLGFLAEHFDAPGGLAMLTEQVRAAFVGGCFAAVWPELTMPPDRKVEIRRLLALAAIRGGGGSPLQLIVAGSWHEQDPAGSNWRNVSEVCDRSGKVRLQHAKIVPYYEAGIGEEAILRGGELPVLVTEDLLIGVAICKDLCDAARPNPYLDLPVDLLLVPSMGEGSTIEGHADAAKALRLRNGTTVFVVQQSLKPQDGNVGYALHSGVHSNPGERFARQAVAWHTYG